MSIDTIASPPRQTRRRTWILDLLLILILLVGAYLRANGLLWGEYQFLHPDERFLVWVGTDISPVDSLSQYFDAANSSLNPVNRGHGFYVYGTLPMFVTRYAVQAIFGHSGFNEMTQVGRVLSALADLLVVFLVYVVGKELYDKRVGVLAAAFSAATVLQIQQSHFFTMDTFINLFSFLAFYFAVRVLVDPSAFKKPVVAPAFALSSNTSSTIQPLPSTEPSPSPLPTPLFTFFKNPLFLYSLGFGIALGAAVASKLNAAPMALALPAAMVLRIIQLPKKERWPWAEKAIVYLAIAAVVSLLVFRVAQPYTFSGPGFFGLKPNPQWLANMRELRAQSSGDVDFPPAMQWARRSITFSGQNLVLWGLGLPLGLLALIGFLWAGWRMLKGEWQRHALIWGWTAMYFGWQSLALNPTLRYQLPIYPMLAIFAAWAVIHLWDTARVKADRKRIKDEGVTVAEASSSFRWGRLLAVFIGGFVVIATFVYAFAFTQIYSRPITRVEASRWIMQNIPGPINLHIQTTNGEVSQPLPFPYKSIVQPGVPYSIPFAPKTSGDLTEIYLPHVATLPGTSQPVDLSVIISNQPNGQEPLAAAGVQLSPSTENGTASTPATLPLDQPLPVVENQNYFMTFMVPGDQQAANLCGPLTLHIQADGQLVDETLPTPQTCFIQAGQPYQAAFSPIANGTLTQVSLSHPDDLQATPGTKQLTLAVLKPGEAEPAAIATLTADLSSSSGQAGQGLTFTLNQPVELIKGENYAIAINLDSGSGAISLAGNGIANEGEWDDGLPLRMDGYDPYGGIYPLDLNFNMYWDDNPDKLARFERIMNQSDYIVITSSRQWGSLPRIPERFPMTTVYYRNLIGCPPEKDIYSCYAEAKPGTFQGNLGFELVKIFQSDPKLGPLDINDQFAEEAFTVYDHPKVLIFKKTDAYDPQKVADILGAVDFSHVIRVPPMRATSHPADLTLPSERLAEQRAGGTWSELFNRLSLQNSSQVVSVVVWYLSVFLLGLMIYPFLRLAFPGLPDKGYPLARTAGMLILSYLVWLAGSYRIPFTRLTIGIVLALLALVGAFLAFHQRGDLRNELRKRGKYFLMIEGLFLAFFIFDLLIRLGNPDLWHPAKGGEKPMDFAYFNAVLKSTSFPPYDPWYAGGYLNYYYYGFVLVGALVKWLGIVPAVAYNLILPTVFSLIAMGAFSIAWNIYSRWLEGRELEISNKELVTGDQEMATGEQGGVAGDQELVTRDQGLGIGEEEAPITNPQSLITIHQSPNTNHRSYAFWVGLAAALLMVVLGNLGTVRMVVEGYEMLAAPNGVIESAGPLTRSVWVLRGFAKVLSGAPLPYGMGDWYWNPSRVIPPQGDVEPITEFPFFTVLYADPHAHLFAMPIALLALTFALAVLLGRGRWKNLWGAAAGFALGGLAIGALRPTNTWDFYTYLALGVVSVSYSLWRYFDVAPSRLRGLSFLSDMPKTSLKLLVALVGVIVLVGLSYLFYQPFAQWYSQAYGAVSQWKGPTTPIDAYFTHWGVFLFIIVSWMAWESRQWMADTPLSALRKLQPYWGLIWGLVGLLAAVVVLLLFLKVSIAWLALPLAAWAGVLILRPNQPDTKRFVLFLVGTGLFMTLFVEVVVLRGDIGRMNTVFKFYLQAWTLFAVSAAAALGWLLHALLEWSPNWRTAWKLALAVLLFGAALYPLMGGMAKIKDRMVPDAPHTLDGMAYMDYAHYDWKGDMDLSQDARAIRWMQENVQGSPVIVEANLRDLYRWGARFSIYTGLPDVVGWEWHQQQQRASLPSSWVSNRIQEIDDFYNTTDLAEAKSFLQKYDARYIIVGQLERNIYPGPGLEKFPAANGVLWKEVYRDGDTVIYEVMN